MGKVTSYIESGCEKVPCCRSILGLQASKSVAGVRKRWNVLNRCRRIRSIRHQDLDLFDCVWEAFSHAGVRGNVENHA